MDNSKKVNLLLNTMHQLQISFFKFITDLVSGIQYKDDPVVLSLTSQINKIVQVLMRYSEISQKKVEDFVNRTATTIYASKVANLARHGGGLHFKILLCELTD